MHDVRWFGSNRHTHLVVPDLRGRGLSVATEGDAPARLAFAASGTVARAAWQYSRRRRVPLVLYVWDLPPWRLGDGRADPVLDFRGRLVRVPRLAGAYRERRGYYSMLSHVARRAAEVWVPSRLTEADVRARFGVEPRHVPYCFDSRLFTPPAGAREEGAPLLSVSRLEPHKDHETALRAAAALDWGIRVVGRGPRAAELRDYAAGVRASATVETDVDDAGLLAAYRAARVVVAPSRFEGFGMTGIEAVACGTPVAASDIPPHREFLEGLAHFFPPGDVRAAAAAIRAAHAAPRPDPARVRGLGIEAAAERFAAGFARLLQRPFRAAAEAQGRGPVHREGASA
ncbi:MAG: glycosyltransferase [Gemmatimonadaceae bacterium]